MRGGDKLESTTSYFTDEDDNTNNALGCGRGRDFGYDPHDMNTFYDENDTTARNLI